MEMHQLMAAALDTAVAEIQCIQKEVRANRFKTRPSWPMIILRSPKGGRARRRPTASQAKARPAPTGCRWVT